MFFYVMLLGVVLFGQYGCGIFSLYCVSHLKGGSTMKLEKLKLLESEIVDEMSYDEVLVAIYYFYNNAWHELNGAGKISRQVIINLEKCKEVKQPFRPAKSKTGWFFCDELECVISLTLENMVQVKTLGVFNSRLNKATKRAINSYKVTYNQLTQLLARDAFRERLAFKVLNTMDSPLTGETQDVREDRILAVLALDIDHFKQVNDTYGHLYGDQVLRTFAIRLEHCAKKIIQENQVEIFLGHPSGEEFLISIYGCLSKEQVVDWANVFRVCICDEPLPSDIEWKKLCEQEDLSSVFIPLLHERNITTSIGIAFYNLNSSEVNKQINSILEDADTALYRAKSSGRNQVIKFEEILNVCGRVLEHDPATNIIAIDIGKNVGVLLGQEFKVFSPSYTGRSKFIVNDGRTSRTIGVYPRLELTTITIFNVQPEMAFAFIAGEKDASMIIEPGSSLEAIPTGSIGHLLAKASRYFPDSSIYSQITDSTLLQRFIDEHLENSNNPYATVFRFSAEQEYLKRYGSASLNESLARLYREVNDGFRNDSRVGILDTSSICLVGKGTAYDEEDLIKKFKVLKGTFSELKLCIGIFCQSDISNAEPEVLEPKYAIEFARYAASDNAGNPGSEIVHFNHRIAFNILNSLRQRKASKQGIVDFENFKSLGVVSEKIFNLGGLMYFSDGDYRKAADLFELALNKNPGDIILKSNLGTVAYLIPDIERGLAVLNTLTDEELEKLRAQHVYGYVAYTALLAQAKSRKSAMFNAERFYMMASNTFDFEDYKNNVMLKDIREAMLV